MRERARLAQMRHLLRVQEAERRVGERSFAQARESAAARRRDAEAAAQAGQTLLADWRADMRLGIDPMRVRLYAQAFDRRERERAAAESALSEAELGAERARDALALSGARLNGNQRAARRLKRKLARRAEERELSELELLFANRTPRP
ncbi:MAG TPA: hypothetical protein VEA80_00810 [Vitreimonas sp.]|uniref:hypothetical protein n=1 Tax=Vitreimonas sp. TaxID=3069702 RepID=UPI002D63D96C|nr:hypothetical protein [Vitreimonas sp.]HYD85991.1 hypothetical protein [Vitreimonas sp.]